MPCVVYECTPIDKVANKNFIGIILFLFLLHPHESAKLYFKTNYIGIINKAMEIRMKNPEYMPASHHHRNILRLYEECLKSGEGLRFKKGHHVQFLPYLYR